jgi:hypothetical protein
MWWKKNGSVSLVTWTRSTWREDGGRGKRGRNRERSGASARRGASEGSLGSRGGESARDGTRATAPHLALLLLVEAEQDSNGELFDLLLRAVGAAALHAHGHISVEEVGRVLDVGRLPRRGVTLDDVR